MWREQRDSTCLTLSLSWLQALWTKQLIPSQDGGFLGSLEVPLLERNHRLRNTSCCSHCHYTLDFLLFWCSAVYLDFTGIKMAWNWFYPHGSHICWESFAWASTRPVSALLIFHFFHSLLLTRFLRKESEPKSQPTVPSSPYAEKRGEIYTNPSSGAMACGTPGIKIPLTKPTLLNFEPHFPWCLWSEQGVSKVL